MQELEIPETHSVLRVPFDLLREFPILFVMNAFRNRVDYKVVESSSGREIVLNFENEEANMIN